LKRKFYAVGGFAEKKKGPGALVRRNDKVWVSSPRERAHSEIRAGALEPRDEKKVPTQGGIALSNGQKKREDPKSRGEKCLIAA